MASEEEGFLGSLLGACCVAITGCIQMQCITQTCGSGNGTRQAGWCNSCLKSSFDEDEFEHPRPRPSRAAAGAAPVSEQPAAQKPMEQSKSEPEPEPAAEKLVGQPIEPAAADSEKLVEKLEEQTPTEEPAAERSVGEPASGKLLEQPEQEQEQPAAQGAREDKPTSSPEQKSEDAS